MTSRIERFDRAVGLILGKLYEEFPHEMRVLDLTKLDPDADADEVELFRQSLNFLLREGFVNARAIASNAPIYGNVSLTMNTLAMMRRVPDSLQPQVTWGDRIGTAAKAVAKEGLSVAVRGFLDYAGTHMGLPRRPPET